MGIRGSLTMAPEVGNVGLLLVEIVEPLCDENRAIKRCFNVNRYWLCQLKPLNVLHRHRKTVH